MAAINSKTAILSEIKALASVEYLVCTNSGTYSAAEAKRTVGTGDPAFATRNVYYTVGGAERIEGPSEDAAPGYMRTINAQSLADDRKRLANLRAQLRDAK